MTGRRTQVKPPVQGSEAAGKAGNLYLRGAGNGIAAFSAGQSGWYRIRIHSLDT